MILMSSNEHRDVWWSQWWETWNVCASGLRMRQDDGFCLCIQRFLSGADEVTEFPLPWSCKRPAKHQPGWLSDSDVCQTWNLNSLVLWKSVPKTTKNFNAQVVGKVFESCDLQLLSIAVKCLILVLVMTTEPSWWNLLPVFQHSDTSNLYMQRETHSDTH